MGGATRTIELEGVLEAMFSYLPEMSMEEGGDTFPVIFGYGDELELNNFLANREVSTTYPLIWLLYPLKEKHTDTKLEVDNASFILAVSTNSSMENKQRMAETFGKMLMPLLYNVRYAFKNANVININNEYDVVKHPNYSKTEERDESAVIAIWDALKVTFSFTIRDTCLREIKFI